MMIKRIKKISIFILSALFLFAFALSVSATVGENYDSSHNQNNCCPGADTNDPSHYDEGYDDGLLDGSTVSEEELENAKKEAADSAILEFKQSDDYKNAILNSFASGIEEGYSQFKSSEEYNNALNEQFTNGVNAGYEAGYNGVNEAGEQMYNKGLADGQLAFKNSEEYTNTIQANYQGGYSEGYTEGHNDGFDVGVENSIEPVELYSIIFTLFAMILLLFVAILIFTKMRGKNKK